MAKLGSMERRFCRKHGIPEERLYDASGLNPSSYPPRMKVEERWAAYGVNPCISGGHSLRDRHGTCLMCDTKRVAFMLRSKLPGFLYIAANGQETVMKIGFSNDPENRIRIMNYEGWGGFYDWSVLMSAWSDRAGALEHHVHAQFSDSKLPLTWERNGREERTTESYEYDFWSAFHAIREICD